MLLSFKYMNAKRFMLGFLIYALSAESGLGQDSLKTIIYLYPYIVTVPASMQKELHLPSAVELDMEGNIYIADAVGNRILKFNPLMELLAATSGWGNTQDRLDNPAGIALDVGLNLIAADYNNGRIVRFDRKLNYLSSVTLAKLEPAFEYPLALTVSGWGDIYVLEERTGGALKLQSSLESVEQFGGFRAGNSSTAGAFSIASTDDGEIFISVPVEKRIKSFDRYGNLTGQISTPEPPYAVTADKDFIWYSSGNELHCLQGKNPVVIEFMGYNPVFHRITGIAVENGQLAVTAEQKPFLYIFRLSTSPAGIQW